MADKKDVKENSGTDVIKKARQIIQDLVYECKKKDAAIMTLQRHINDGTEVEHIDDSVRQEAIKLAHQLVEKGFITPVTKDAVASKLTKVAGLQECVKALIPRAKSSYGEAIKTKSASKKINESDSDYFKNLGV